MYNLYARQREKPNFEYISTFENKEQKYSEIDKLDRNIYQEAIVVNEQGCELYMEFPVKVKKLVRRNNGTRIIRYN